MNEFTTPTGTRVLADRYVLDELIGSGGAGVVWRAHDRVLERTVAVKLLHPAVAADPRAAARFRDEASAAAKLTHPNAVILYDIGQSGDGDYLVMELVDGGTLDDVLDGPPLSPELVAALGSQVALALGAAHDSGLVHRDVKPANILITPEGVAKVTDFGIARALGETTSRLTTPGHVVGTARYLAPEQLRDEPIDARADVYSLGLLLHHALTGRPPFGDGSAVEVAMRRFADRLPPPSEQRPDVPDELDAAIVRATQVDPSLRFADGSEFASVLARVAGSGSTRALARRVPPAPDVTAVVPAAGGDTAVADETVVLQPAGPSVPPREDPGGVDDPPNPGRFARVWLAVMVSAVVVAIAAALVISRSGADDPRAEVDDVQESREEDLEDEDPREAVPIEVVDGGDHDPFGSGEEHGGDVANAFDGNDDTTWQTQRYRGNPQLGGLKPGVGIWLDLGEPHEVGEIAISMTEAGAAFTLYAGDAPPEPASSPDEWGAAVTSVEDAEEQTTLELEEPTEARVWLLWLTSLPPDDGQYRARVAEVQLR